MTFRPVRLRLHAIMRQATIFCALSCIVMTACQPVEISRTRPWWEELQLDQQVEEGPGASLIRPALKSDSPQVIHNAELELMTENEDGTVTLNCLLPEYLVSNLYNLLMREEYDLIFEHLISDNAKTNYREQGRDPHEVIDWMQSNRRDVLLLCMRMSRGFNSPDVVWKKSGSVYRMQLYGRTAQDMRYGTMDITRENGQFKLVLIK